MDLLTKKASALRYHKLEPAYLLSRFLAVFIGVIIFTIIVVISIFPLSRVLPIQYWDYLAYLFPVLYIIIPILFPCHTTLGEKIMHIKIISISGKNPKISQILIRSLVLIILLIVLFCLSIVVLMVLQLFIYVPMYGGGIYLIFISFLLLYLPAFWSKSSLTLHDRISKTFVATII
jgi:uncharacterized RDD family membrane protein YckC